MCIDSSRTGGGIGVEEGEVETDALGDHFGFHI